MISRTSRFGNRRDQGFTLVELLVVIVIIGVLAAIAIPVFLNQRQKAVDSSLRSDLKNLSTAAETYATDNHEATYYGSLASPTNASVTAALGSSSPVEFRKTPGNIIQIKGSPLDGYCLRARSDGGTMGTAETYYHFDARGGGLLPGPPTATVSGGACGVTTGDRGVWYTVS